MPSPLLETALGQYLQNIAHLSQCKHFRCNISLNCANISYALSSHDCCCQPQQVVDNPQRSPLFTAADRHCRTSRRDFQTLSSV